MDADDSADTAARYGVRALPTLLIFVAGKPVAQLVGAHARAKLDAWIDDEQVVTIPGGRYATTHFFDTVPHMHEAWQGLLRDPIDWAPMIRALWVCAVYGVPAIIAAATSQARVISHVPAPAARDAPKGPS